MKVKITDLLDGYYDTSVKLTPPEKLYSGEASEKGTDMKTTKEPKQERSWGKMAMTIAASMLLVVTLAGAVALMFAKPAGQSLAPAETEETPAEVTESPAESDPIETAVVQFLLDFQKAMVNNPILECGGEGHVILGNESAVPADGTAEEMENPEEVTVYAVCKMAGYGFMNDNFVRYSMGPIPMKITVARQEDGTYLAIDKVYGKSDASPLAEELDVLFPEGIAEAMEDVEQYEAELNAQCDAYAQAYLDEMGRTAEILDANGGIELESPTDQGMSLTAWEELIHLMDLDSHAGYPDFIGTLEHLEDGVRYVYKFGWNTEGDGTGYADFSKMEYDSKEIVEERSFWVNGDTVEDVTVTEADLLEDQAAAKRTSISVDDYFQRDDCLTVHLSATMPESMLSTEDLEITGGGWSGFRVDNKADNGDGTWTFHITGSTVVPDVQGEYQLQLTIRNTVTGEMYVGETVTIPYAPAGCFAQGGKTFYQFDYAGMVLDVTRVIVREDPSAMELTIDLPERMALDTPVAEAGFPETIISDLSDAVDLNLSDSIVIHSGTEDAETIDPDSWTTAPVHEEYEGDTAYFDQVTVTMDLKNAFDTSEITMIEFPKPTVYAQRGESLFGFPYQPYDDEDPITVCVTQAVARNGALELTINTSQAIVENGVTDWSTLADQMAELLVRNPIEIHLEGGEYTTIAFFTPEIERVFDEPGGQFTDRAIFTIDLGSIDPAEIASILFPGTDGYVGLETTPLSDLTNSAGQLDLTGDGLLTAEFQLPVESGGETGALTGLTIDLSTGEYIWHTAVPSLQAELDANFGGDFNQALNDADFNRRFTAWGNLFLDAYQGNACLVFADGDRWQLGSGDKISCQDGEFTETGSLLGFKVYTGQYFDSQLSYLEIDGVRYQFE